MKQIVIFDLDGTLLDTIGDLAAACNEILARHELPTHELDDYRHFVGNGIMRLVERALPEELRTPEFVAEIRAEFVEYYTANIDKFTTPYTGVEPLLNELSHREVTLAVASNKFQEGTRKLVKKFFPAHRFAAVLGQRPDVPLKPHPHIIREIIQITSFTPDKFLYIGDSGIDIETAKAAGVESVGVTWGFRSREELVESGADHIVDHPREILKLLE
ncbi:MAG: HAD hydrolase-like protein [Rikenellaceae bacterium]